MHAVIDIGSNSVLLLLARRDAEGELEILEDRATITRISEGAGGSGHLSDAAIERTLAVLTEYRKRAEAAGAESLTAVATEGVRMAENAGAFLGPAADRLGVEVRLVTGDEEARLSYESVALESAEDAVLRVIDVGGASTELCAGVGLEISDLRSHPVGAVRLTERHVSAPDAPISAEVIAAIDGDAQARFSTQPLDPHPVLCGLAGTVTTIAAMHLVLGAYDRDAVHGAELSRADVQSLRDSLAGMSAEARVAAHPTLAPKRADVIVAGATILLAAMAHCGAETLSVRDRGLRYALIPRGST
jgi:exopolyphosphatase/guanosine-5'-triphosphate,3'-diphosphate pyrophosphatase